MELLGRKFHTIEKGLDPNDVIEFLKTAPGSSEDVFQRLEQFSALQAAARTMEESILQARRLTEYARKQAESEARQKKAQAVEEAGQQAALMIDQAKESCISVIDSTHDVLLVAIQEALDSARGTVSYNLTQLSERIRKAADERLKKWLTGDVQTPEQPIKPKVEPVDKRVSDKLRKDRENERTVPAPMSTRGSLTVIDKGDSPQSGGKSARPVPEPIEGDMVEASEGLYSGTVVIIIPRNVKDTWMQQFRSHMLRAPGVQIRGEMERDKERIEVMLFLEKPTELLPLLQNLPNVRKVMEAWDTGIPPEGWGAGRVNRSSRKSEEVALILQFA